MTSRSFVLGPTGIGHGLIEHENVVISSDITQAIASGTWTVPAYTFADVT